MPCFILAHAVWLLWGEFQWDAVLWDWYRRYSCLYKWTIRWLRRLELQRHSQINDSKEGTPKNIGSGTVSSSQFMRLD